ncbi:MAG: hypothetical protein ACLR8Y_10980 [Alistipes indistinctus]
MKDETAKGTEPDIRFTKKDNVLYVFARSWKAPAVRVQDLLLTPHESVKRVCAARLQGKNRLEDGRQRHRNEPAGQVPPRGAGLCLQTRIIAGRDFPKTKGARAGTYCPRPDAGDMLFRVCREYRANRWRPVC